MIYPRIKDLREDKDLRQQDVAKIINTSANYYGEYEKGNRPLPFDRAIALAEFYKVSLDYIAGRTNDKRGFNKSDLPKQEENLIKKFRTLNAEQKGIILGRIEAMTEDNEKNSENLKGAV